VACSEGDGNEDLLNQFPREAEFCCTPTSVIAGGQVELRQVGSGTGKLEVEVWVRGVTNLWALAFTLEYDPTIIRFDSAEALDFLGPDSEVSLVASEPPGRTDQVMVGITRLATPPAARTGKTGTGAVLRLSFDLEGVGETDFRFVPNTAGMDPKNLVILDSTHFFDGTVTTR